MTVYDLEDVIDKEYSSADIKEVSLEGILLPDCLISFAGSIRNHRGNFPRPEIKGKPYVGDKNCLTDPPYMKFVVEGKVLIILFQSRDEFYEMQDKIREAGYETFDLS